VFSKFGETASIFTKIGKTGDYKYAYVWNYNGMLCLL